MGDAKVWVERLVEWRASRLTAAKFADGRDFTAHQLWNWAAKMRREEARAAVPARPASVRIARVVRVPRLTLGGQATAALLSVELLGVRVFVPPGFDRLTFSAVLDEIEALRTRGRAG